MAASGGGERSGRESEVHARNYLYLRILMRIPRYL